jgi:hypothetical protein
MSSAISYISEAAVVVGSKIIREHPSPTIRSLAGQTVKVFPETAYDVFSQCSWRHGTPMDTG